MRSRRSVGLDFYADHPAIGKFERLLITERLPAWSSSRLNRLIRLPKRYLVDPGFIGPLLGVDARAVLRDGDLLGRLLDTFVMAQLRAECTVSELSPRLFHARDANNGAISPGERHVRASSGLLAPGGRR